MKRTISTRVLQVLLVSLFLVAPCQAEQRPEKLWKGIGPINDKYDWLRPPDSILEAAMTQTHWGRAKYETFTYRYKKRIQIGPFDWIERIWLTTPTTSAAGVGDTARQRFEDKPPLGQAKISMNSLGVTVVVEAYKFGDLPKVAILKGGALLRPSIEAPLDSSRIACSDYPDLSCWWSGKHFAFWFNEQQRLSGSGFLLLRWNDVEKRIPVNFDYLW